MVIVFADQFRGLDILRLLKMVILHDLGEAIHGDMPAPEQDPSDNKADQERADFESLIRPLPVEFRKEFLGLWDDCENVRSPEAQISKAFDKLEILLQHTQSKNLPNFDYAFNLVYGKKHTDATDLTRQIRATIDAAIRERMQQ